MKPKFKNILEYEKAQILLQPIYIRLVDNIRKESELSKWEVDYKEISEPFPDYIISLKKGDYLIQNNLWDLCFQICFTSYQQGQINPVEIDQKLIDDQGELNWEELENKTNQLVKNLFISID
ncbi:hypothetical protein [Geminocystis sp. NIES-3709]|uniref:hypothetical protein n=1 Tax=Geminocystis sp. NIES-3709 TaxID=1617448 RepID=UPI0005FC80F8|nr:hypothetical protein [Geminocystis sp. NIES-3709]BAQ66908.1 hypothetical protein GM3709_3673 [Geminocystis sp. NIES-3709]